MMNKNMMRQIKDMQAKLAKTQEELADTNLEVSAGGGAVKIVITGNQKFLSIKISPEAVDPNDLSLLEDLVLAAVSEAMEKSQQLAQERLGGVTAGLKLPGM
ncbi:MAG: YbaB/EbfC family nucleoid-associated protein [Dehalococcoidia bacterium]|nr:YbaB/EbfC family nucleoid-associated protein [Dehalococcoidia bacterium]